MKIGDRPVRYAGQVYLVVLLLWLMPVSAFAGLQLDFEWDPNPEPDIAGYRVFSRLAGADYDYDNSDWEGQDAYCSIWVENEDATHYFVVRAYDMDGFESDDSNEVAYTPGVSPPPEDPPPEDPPPEDPPPEDPPPKEPPPEDPPPEDPPPEEPPPEDPPPEDPPPEEPPPEEPPPEDPPPEDPPPEDPPPEDPPPEDPPSEDPQNLLVLDAATGRGQVYLYVDECLGVASVEDFSAIDADSVQNVFNRPDDLFLGLFHIELVLENIGGIVTIPIYFSAPINGDVQWYIYDAVNGWLNYSDHSRFNEDGMSIVVDLKDGGYGDADGVENGVIVCTSGPGHVLSSGNIYAVSGQSPTNADGGCFIDAIFP